MKLLATITGILLLSATSVLAQENCNPAPPYGTNELAALSIFQENYNNGDYEFALTYGRWFLCAKTEGIAGIPEGRFSLETQYNKLIKIYTEIGLSKEDPAEREAYIDSALALYDETFEMFIDTDEAKYDFYQRRGRYFLENYNNIENGLQKAYSDFEMMFELNPEKTTNLADGYYMKVTIDNMVRQGRKDEVIGMIETASEFAEPAMSSHFDEVLEGLFDAPEERITFYGEKLEENPEDLEALQALANAYEDLDMRPELEETIRKIHALQPTFESALQLADIEKGNANYQEAAGFYEEALGKAETDKDKKEINLDLADVYASMNQLARAKRYINASLAVDSGYGLAYLKMANIYGQAVSSCSEGRKLDANDKVVYWVVVDYLNKAKQMDRSVTNTVNSQLSTYQAVTPSTEDKFFTLGYEDGQKVNVDSSLRDCYSWINETTTVR